MAVINDSKLWRKELLDQYNMFNNVVFVDVETSGLDLSFIIFDTLKI